MKQMFQAYFLSSVMILLLSILVSLIIGALFFFHITDTHTTTMCIWVLSILLYLIGGSIFGYYIQSRILIHLFCIGLLLISLFFIFVKIQGFVILRIICKILAFSIGTIFIHEHKLKKGSI